MIPTEATNDASAGGSDMETGWTLSQIEEMDLEYMTSESADGCGSSNEDENEEVQIVRQGKGARGQWVNLTDFDFTTRKATLSRKGMGQTIKALKGFEAHGWQLDVATVCGSGKDALCIAPTGIGKSLVYQLLVTRPNTTSILISPLTELIREQVDELQSFGLKVANFTGEFLARHPDTWKEFETGKFDVVVGSPEVLFAHGGRFWRDLNRANNNTHPFFKRLKMIILDEGHMMYKWGLCHSGDGTSAFRPEFALIGNFRMLFPNVPFLVLSATMNKVVEAYVHETLGLQFPTFRVRIPLFRSNIQLLVAGIESTLATFKDLEFVVGGFGTERGIPQTMVYTDDKTRATRIAQFLRSIIKKIDPEADRSTIMVYTASQDADTRVEIMKRFREKRCKIMICSEAAGMGLNIKHIELVVQYRVPKFLSLADLIQRIGRAGRDSRIKAAGILLVEKRFILTKTDNEEPHSKGRNFHLAITPETVADGSANDMLYNMYSEPNRILALSNRKANRKKKMSEDDDEIDSLVLDPALIWYINTSGCRQRVQLAALGDFTALQFPTNDPLEQDKCDNCVFPPRLSHTGYTAPLCLTEGLNRKGIKSHERASLKRSLIIKNQTIHDGRQASIASLNEIAIADVFGLSLKRTLRYQDSAAAEHHDILTRKGVIQSRQTAKIKRFKTSLSNALLELRKTIYTREDIANRFSIIEPFIFPNDVIMKIANSPAIYNAESTTFTIEHMKKSLEDSTVFSLEDSLIASYTEEIVEVVRKSLAAEEDLRKEEAAVAREERRARTRSVTPFYEDFERRDDERRKSRSRSRSTTRGAGTNPLLEERGTFSNSHPHPPTFQTNKADTSPFIAPAPPPVSTPLSDAPEMSPVSLSATISRSPTPTGVVSLYDHSPVRIPAHLQIAPPEVLRPYQSQSYMGMPHHQGQGQISQDFFLPQPEPDEEKPQPPRTALPKKRGRPRRSKFDVPDIRPEDLDPNDALQAERYRIQVERKADERKADDERESQQDINLLNRAEKDVALKTTKRRRKVNK